MNDVQELIRLVQGGVRCLSIITHEEHQALEVLRKAAQELGWKMRIWSVGRGTRDGLFAVLDRTENPTPEEGLQEFCRLPSHTFCAALDLGKHLQSHLILGVQGAGKSLCAKAIATAWHQPLFRLDCGVLYNKYIGESEHNLRTALRQIEAMSPAILWIDEIEKAFASAASQSTDGGLSKRMFATLLTWIQEHQQLVFLVATANDIEALPPELLRKGRFDEIFFVGLPDEKTRREIFAIHLKKRKRNPKQFDLDTLAEAAKGFSGSEIEQVVIAALHEAFSQESELDTETLLRLVRSSVPLSVTMREQIEALCQWAQGRVIWAD